MIKRLKTSLGVIAGLSALALGGSAIAGAAKGDFKLVVFGLLLSIPLVVWGSGLLAHLMNKFRVIIRIAG